MKLFVLIKRTFDTEERITVENKQIVEEGSTFIINPYDEFAIEEALRLREQHGGIVTVVTLGNQNAEKELRTALAMGADQAVLLCVPSGVSPGPDVTAATIADYLRTKEVDIILAGNASIDGGSGQVGPRVAQALQVPCVTSVVKIEISNDQAIVTQDVEGNSVVVQTTLPLVITCQQGLNEPRYPSLPGIMKAKKKPLEVVEIIPENQTASQVERLEVFLPAGKLPVQILSGSMNEQISALTEIIQKAGVTS